MTNTGNRFVTALLFTFIGPLVGTAGLFSFMILSAAATGGAPDWNGAFPTLSLFVVMGYLFGFGPALLTGVIYALLPGALQRLVLSPLYGAIATWVLFTIALQVNALLGTFGQSSLMWGTGAFAAFGCAMIARMLGWTPKHEGGEPHGGTENTAH